MLHEYLQALRTVQQNPEITYLMIAVVVAFFSLTDNGGSTEITENGIVLKHEKERVTN